MVQRSSTVVVTSDALMEHAWGRLYSESAVESGITTEIADLTVASVPFKLLPSLQKPVYDAIRKRDAALYEGLEKVGFLYDFGEDGSGIHSTYLRRGAGYYIDVGASQLVIDGRIKLKSKVEISRINEHSVTLSDGAEIPADLLVYATGYGSMNQWAADLISPEVACRVGKCWGLGSGTRHDPGPWGELRNMEADGSRACWFQGIMQARHYRSRCSSGAHGSHPDARLLHRPSAPPSNQDRPLFERCNYFVHVLPGSFAEGSGSSARSPAARGCRARRDPDLARGGVGDASASGRTAP
jgi:putative flavoprotein involved in K+ transport